MATLYPGSTPPPGYFIKEELEARGWSQRDLAYILDVTGQAVNLILSGKRDISPEMAKALGKAFDVPAEFFLNLQNAYDLLETFLRGVPNSTPGRSPIFSEKPGPKTRHPPLKRG